MELRDWTGPMADLFDPPMLPVAGPSSVEPNLPLLDSNLGFDEADVGSLQSRPSSSSLFADLASYLDKRLLPCTMR